MIPLLTYVEWISAFIAGVLTGVFVTREVMVSKTKGE